MGNRWCRYGGLHVRRGLAWLLRLQRNRFGSVEALHGKVGQAQSNCHADQLNGQRVAVVKLLDAATGYRTHASATEHHVEFLKLFGAVCFFGIHEKPIYRWV